MLFQAGRAAELSGELKDAVAFYQQALKIADPKSDEAGEAITAVYALLIHPLDNPAGAYAFGLNEAETLAVNPRFRQFDRWFLDMAIASKDGEAVAKRLLATMKAGVSDDQLVALYAGDFRWLLNAVDGYVEQPQAVPFTQELYEAVKELSEAIDFDEELKLQLDWAVSVKAYNLAQIGGRSCSKAEPSWRRGQKERARRWKWIQDHRWRNSLRRSPRPRPCWPSIRSMPDGCRTAGPVAATASIIATIQKNTGRRKWMPRWHRSSRHCQN